MMEKKYWFLAIIISVAAAGSAGYFAGRSELPAAPLEGWDNYKLANIGKEIQLHGAILHVYMVYGTPPYGEHEVSKFEHVLGEEYASRVLLGGTSHAVVFSHHTILDISTHDVPPIGFKGGSGPVDVTGIIRQAPEGYWDYFEIYLEVTKIESTQAPPLLIDEIVEMGRNYLENGLSGGGPSPWVGGLLWVKLEVRDPNYYWHYNWGEEVDSPVGENTLCWVIRFEKAKRPGHWFEVWVDADSLDIVGGMQCR